MSAPVAGPSGRAFPSNMQTSKKKQTKKKIDTKRAKIAQKKKLDQHQPLLPGRSAISRQRPTWTIERAVELPDTNASSDEWKQHFQERLDQMPWMGLEEIQMLVWDAGESPEALTLQKSIIKAGLTRVLDLLHPDKGFQPSQLQVDVVYGLIFGEVDVFMVARTGAGKSLVFQAFTMLTGLITIQIVPLNRIGEEQADDIKKAIARLEDENPLVRPLNITAETKKLEKKIYDNIAAGKYQHIILGPEQAALPEFRSAIKQIMDRIGMLTIDEIHLLLKWMEFRPAFSLLYQLRMILPADAVLLGCTATAPKATEQYVLKHAGYREQRDNAAFRTQVIRDTVDRPDTSYIFKTIPKDQSNKYDMLYFVLRNAVNDQGEATPAAIQKTLIFLDARGEIDKLVETIRKWLVLLTEDQQDMSKKYTYGGGGIDVTKLVQFYTSHVAKFDQDARYEEFKKADAELRIMIGTPAVAIGTNISDIRLLIHWKYPITKDIDDLMQKLGRAGRALGIQALAVVFLNYWIDDSLKRVPEGSDHKSMVPRDEEGAVAAYREQAYIPERPSGLRNVIVPGEEHALEEEAPEEEDDDAESDYGSDVDPEEGDDVVDVTPAPAPTSATAASREAARAAQAAASATAQEGASIANEENAQKDDWTKQEMESRDKIPEIWRLVWNSRYNRQAPRCPRKVLLEYFCEHERMYDPDREVTPDECCDACNPSLLDKIIWKDPPPLPPAPSPPRANTRQAFALELLQRWFSEQADKLFPDVNKNRLFTMSYRFLIDNANLWDLCEVYGTEKISEKKKKLLNTLKRLSEVTIEDVKRRAPRFSTWYEGEYTSDEAVYNDLPLQDLVQALNDIAPKLYEKYKAHLAKKKAKKDAAEAAAQRAEEELEGAEPVQDQPTPQEQTQTNVGISAAAATRLRMQKAEERRKAKEQADTRASAQSKAQSQAESSRRKDGRGSKRDASKDVSGSATASLSRPPAPMRPRLGEPGQTPPPNRRPGQGEGQEDVDDIGVDEDDYSVTTAAAQQAHREAALSARKTKEATGEIDNTELPTTRSGRAVLPSPRVQGGAAFVGLGQLSSPTRGRSTVGADLDEQNIRSSSRQRTASKTRAAPDPKGKGKGRKVD